MPIKKRIYPINRVRHDYTYSVEDIAELFGLCTPTIFRWIGDEGLERIPNTKKYFVHSHCLIKFLNQKNGKHKKPAQAYEVYCCKCRIPTSPKIETIKAKLLPNKTVRVSGKCSVCNTSINKVVSGKDWHGNHPLYLHIHAEPSIPKGDTQSQRKCKDRSGEQLCLNITL